MTADFLVCGAGIIGLCIARELKTRFPGRSVVVIDKETSCHAHGSGRNSGVLHAGFYYSADSLKARFTRDGNRLLTQWCEENKLTVRKCGKLVVVRSPEELPLLEELRRRGERNGVVLETVDVKTAAEIQPGVRTFEKALFSPTTSSVDPRAVMERKLAECREAGVHVRLGEPFVAGGPGWVQTSLEKIKTGYFINAAGLYADRIARAFGYSKNYAVLPFKGLYLLAPGLSGRVRTHIYPVPDPHYPFLGVHFTLKAGGEVKIGPTAIPAFWREQYAGFENFRAGEFADILWREARLMFSSGFDFKKLAFTEMRKYSKRVMAGMAAQLLEGVSSADFKEWGRPGIRAQLVNTRTLRLVDDFLLEGDSRSMHVLNAVSPGFTCSMPFAAHVCDEIEALAPRHAEPVEARRVLP